MWSTFLEEKGLVEHLSTTAGIGGKNVERGVESYEVPECESSLHEEGKSGKPKPSNRYQVVICRII